ncbi:MAG: DUF2341 domain-containing protein, partial [Candidatus Pacebacteria bacterium]|nr:DUF2341 domain-containing protein [Candidatus Paceibacterota bacterium]
MNFHKFVKVSIIFFIIFAWIFSSWPQIWKNPSISPKINKIQAEAPTDQWWNTSYKYRQKITVTASITAVPVGYTATTTIDHAALFTSGKSLSSGNDMRAVYWNGSIWTELDRILNKNSNWNTSTTTILFKTQAAIATSTSDDNYYFYYGNSGAGAPPTNESNVFDFYDDFSGDLSKWTIDSENTDEVYIATSSGNPAPSLRHDPDSSQTKSSYFDTRLITTNYKMQDAVIEYDVYLAGSTASSPRIIHQLGFRVQSLNFENGYCWRLQNSAADAGHLRFTGKVSWSAFGTAYPATTGNAWHFVKEVVSGSTYTGYVDGGNAYSGTDSTKLTADYLVSHVHGVSLTTSSYVLVDNIRVRKYVSPEPTTSLSSEEQFTIGQSAYRWFNNLDSTDVGTPLANQDTSVTLGSVGAAFRLRTLLHITGGLPQNGQQFKLQYVGKGTGTCASPSGGTPSSYTDVSTSTLIAFNDNSTPLDDSALTYNSNDPTHGSDPIVNQTYEELNNFTNSIAAIPTGQDGKWDFSLKDNSAPVSATYCFRVVKSDDTVLNTYTVIPEITTAASSIIVSNVKLNNQNAIDLIENTTKSISAVADIFHSSACNLITNVTAKIYRSAVANGKDCTPDNNNCYSVASCTETSCVGTDAVYTCTINMQFHTDPTDSGSTWESEYWQAWIEATDGTLTESNYSPADAPEVNTLSALNINPTTINYEIVNPDNVSSEKTVEIQTTGNASIDVKLSGINMTWSGNTILV